jgi:hypothetical protein
MKDMNPFDPYKYGPVFTELLQVDRARSLGAGTPETSLRAALDALTVVAAFAHAGVADEAMAKCCVSGTWLLCDYLDESHTISQGIATPSGSFWHAIMHRREGDFSNAKYWFRRVGGHPVYERLADECGADSWDPMAFVDACQQAVRGGAEVERCRELQQREWEMLFDYCYVAATES